MDHICKEIKDASLSLSVTIESGKYKTLFSAQEPISQWSIVCVTCVKTKREGEGDAAVGRRFEERQRTCLLQTRLFSWSRGRWGCHHDPPMSVSVYCLPAHTYKHNMLADTLVLLRLNKHTRRLLYMYIKQALYFGIHSPWRSNVFPHVQQMYCSCTKYKHDAPIRWNKDTHTWTCMHSSQALTQMERHYYY